ncbi:hypothetical protein EDB19DRAFT_990561 [Suillus lakei]|nr:hypothetical protein EDB19DRAFT_990561 [Suillus lakei]
MSSVSGVAELQIAKVCKDLGGLAILIFDYCITFQEEVRWTWCRPWGLTRIIFTISRYLPFLRCVSTVQCTTSLAENIIHIISIVAAEGLLVIRTWAFWKMSKRVLIGLLTYSAVTIIAVVAVNVSPNHQLIPGGASTIPGCVFESSRNAAVVYAILAVFECVILILTRAAYKWFQDCREIRTSIITTVYGGSMLYILCIIAITVTNVIIDAVFPVRVHVRQTPIFDLSLFLGCSLAITIC